MSIRVVLYAEGAGETSGSITLLPPPGAALTDEMLGPAHHLVGRAIAETWSVPAEAVRFESPLRTSRGTVARGSDLLDRGTLRKLLTWAKPTLRPELTIVLVDEDGDRARGRRLTESTAGMPGSRVIAVAVREFETWMLADEAALRAAIGGDVASIPALEDLPRGEAKERFNALCDDGAVVGRKPRRRECREQVSKTTVLAEVARRCRSFATFVDDLKRVHG